MRRTLFLVPIARRARRPCGRLAGGRGDRAQADDRDVHRGGYRPGPGALLEELEAAGLAAVREHGEATTAELTALDPRLGQKMTIARGKSYEATISVSQKVFFHLALDGRIGRGRPRGTWIGSQIQLEPDRAVASGRDRRDAR